MQNSDIKPENKIEYTIQPNGTQLVLVTFRGEGFVAEEEELYLRDPVKADKMLSENLEMILNGPRDNEFRDYALVLATCYDRLCGKKTLQEAHVHETCAAIREQFTNRKDRNRVAYMEKRFNEITAPLKFDAFQ